MLRKSILLVAGLGLLSVFFFGRDAVSYVKTTAAKMQDSVRGSVPIDFEIDRVRKMITDLVPDIRRNMHVIAKEEVEVERLTKQIADTEVKLQQQREDILRLRADVSENQSVYHYSGRRYTQSQVKSDLAARFERYKTNEATLASLRDIHDARIRSLEAARQKLEGMLAAKRQLTVDAENLEARLKMVEVAQTTSEYNFDDSQLARVKDLMGEIRTRLAVAEKLVNSDVQFEGEIRLEDANSDDIADEVAEYFELDRSEVAEAAY